MRIIQNICVNIFHQKDGIFAARFVSKLKLLILLNNISDTCQLSQKQKLRDHEICYSSIFFNCTQKPCLKRCSPYVPHQNVVKPGYYPPLFTMPPTDYVSVCRKLIICKQSLVTPHFKENFIWLKVVKTNIFTVLIFFSQVQAQKMRVFFQILLL